MITLCDILKKLPDGHACYAVRNFNMSPKADGRVPSVKALAESLGFGVERKLLPAGLSGRLVPDAFSENGYCIEVNERDNVLRQRWTVLHEMGHYFLGHIKRDDPFAECHLQQGDSFYLETSKEREANEFAAALVFDQGALEAAASLFSGDRMKLSKHFGVSEMVIRVAVSQFLK